MNAVSWSLTIEWRKGDVLLLYMYQKEGKFLENCFNPHATNMNVMETKQVTDGMKIAKYEIRLQTKMVSYALG